MAAYLAAHPQLSVAHGKEVHFFNNQFHRGVDWYADQFDQGDGEVHVGEATPGYLFNARAVERMATVLPNAKLIVVLREPVDRAYSHYWLNRWRGIEPLAFEQAIAAEWGRLERRPHDPRTAYFGLGCYVDQLRRLRRFFPTQQVHIAFLENMKASPERVVIEVCRYLGVDELLPSVGGERLNHHGPIRSFRVAALTRSLPLPMSQTVRRWNTRNADYPTLSPRTRSQLSQRFAHANADLRSLVPGPIPWSNTHPTG